jgi:F-type H+-transporting ATPase subunit gamma
LNRRTERFLADEKTKYESIELVIIGRKGREHFKRRSARVVAEHAGVASETALTRARELAAESTRDFLDGKVDAVYVVYNEFKSAISQTVQIQPLLPIQPGELKPDEARIDFEYEPDQKSVLATLIPLHLEIQLFRIMLEAIASEFGARMSAMDSATKNAKEMIGSLTLEFNRARQAAITKELMEIVGGAEALKG